MIRPAPRFVALCLAVLAHPVLAGPLAPTQPAMPGKAVSLNAQTIDLTLGDAVFLGLRDNRAIRSAYLERIAQKFDLRVEEDRFTPKLVLSGRHLANRNQDDRYRQSEVIPQATLLGEYGTQFSLSWSNQLTQADRAGRTRNDGATFTVIQPLLRGAGRDVATAPVRLARLAEQANRLALKATVSDTITQVITENSFDAYMWQTLERKAAFQLWGTTLENTLHPSRTPDAANDPNAPEHHWAIARMA